MRTRFERVGLVRIAASIFGMSLISQTAWADIAIPVRGFLCDNAEHAVQFANYRAHGESEEIAKDRVGRLSKAEVCGRYIGVAVIQSEQVTLRGGIAYKVTAFRFGKDQRVAWLAERSFAPTQTNWSL